LLWTAGVNFFRGARDALQAVAHLSNQPFVDKSRVALVALTSLTRSDGEADTETPAAECVEKLDAVKRSGAPIEWHVYPTTTHCWDWPTQAMARRLNYVGQNGTMRPLLISLPMIETLIDDRRYFRERPAAPGSGFTSASHRARSWRRHRGARARNSKVGDAKSTAAGARFDRQKQRAGIKASRPLPWPRPSSTGCSSKPH
jgi:hypothetical protein